MTVAAARAKPTAAAPESAPPRVAVESVSPVVDAGRFPAKACAGDAVRVEADIFADGHDEVAASLHWQTGDGHWQDVAMQPLGNDRWVAAVTVDEVGLHSFEVVGWVDHHAGWRRDLSRRLAALAALPASAGAESARLAGDVAIDLQVGAERLQDAARRAGQGDAAARTALLEWSARMASAARAAKPSASTAATKPVLAMLAMAQEALSDDLAALVRRHAGRDGAGRAGPFPLRVDPERARSSAWYEFFPRSFGGAGRHGTLRDAAGHLPYVARLGFDTVYLPPIHPIGRSKRKGRNNDPAARPGEPGSPWAIGADEGGHTAVHPDLGTVEDLEAFVAAARRLGLDVAMDVAFQCSPDHPYVRDHPDWFLRLPDGSVRHAENPPKRYEDIVPFDFACADWRGLWQELLGVVLFWAERGIRTFRVDNPHTKPFPFWEYLIAEVRTRHPDALFLSEAFTRPKVMHHLAKVGFTHSMTYFTWRTGKAELADYLLELTQGPGRHYLRPHFWPNTPDILPQHLQEGGRPAFVQRLVLAATMAANYGVYGPAFELGVAEPLAPGKEEYRDSEKYQLRQWDLSGTDSIADVVARVNAIRKAHPALRQDSGVAVHSVQNDHLLAYSKRSRDGGDTILVIVNLDPARPEAGMTELDLAALGVDPARPFTVEDLLTGASYVWHGPRNYVDLDPVRRMPAHVLAVRQEPAAAAASGPPPAGPRPAGPQPGQRRGGTGPSPSAESA